MSKSTTAARFIPTQHDADLAGVTLDWFGPVAPAAPAPARKATSAPTGRRSRRGWDARRIHSEIVAGERSIATRRRRDARLDALAGEAAWHGAMG